MAPHGPPTRVRARMAIACAVALAIGATSSVMPSALLAQPAEEGTGGSTAPTGPTGAVKPTPCRRARLHLRCPDLIMSAPANLHLDRTTLPGRVLLRATSSIDNRGQGPLEVRAHREGAHRWMVYQAIYDRKGHPHLFKTPATLVFKYVPGERYGFPAIEAFSYWKFHHAAGFELWSVDPDRKVVRLVRRGPKVDYCLRDLFRTAPSPRSPSEPVYPACNQDPNVKRDVLGTSVGWTDSYPYEYPGQWIDVTGLRGRFAYVQVADPDHLLIESNHENDISETYVELPSGRVLGHRIGVASP
jgi:Lysyl oxidase